MMMMGNNTSSVLLRISIATLSAGSDPQQFPTCVYSSVHEQNLKGELHGQCSVQPAPALLLWARNGLKFALYI